MSGVERKYALQMQKVKIAFFCKKFKVMGTKPKEIKH